MIVKLKNNKSIIMYELNNDFPVKQAHDIIDEQIKFLDTKMWTVLGFDTMQILFYMSEYIKRKWDDEKAKKV